MAARQNEASDLLPPAYPTVLRTHVQISSPSPSPSGLLPTLTLAIINIKYHYSCWYASSPTCLRHAVKAAADVDGESHCTSKHWQVFIRKWLLPCSEHPRLISSDGCEGKWNFPVGSFSTHSESCSVDARLKDAKWVFSLNSSGLQTRPFMWPASQPAS